MTTPEHAEREAAIERDLDDPAAYLDHARWLQARGEPRGELIELHWAGRTHEASALLEVHGAYFWGRAAPSLAALQAHGCARGRPTSWRWGYLDALWLSDQVDYYQRTYARPSAPAFDADDVLDALLGHASTRFLRELSIGTLAFDEADYRRTAQVIARHPRPTLRKLTLGDIDTEEEGVAGTIGNLEPLAEALPRLESLTLLGGVLAPGRLRPPRLKELEIITMSSDPESLHDIYASRWPSIETLRLRLGPNTVAPDNLAPVFDGTTFPCLAHLDLRSVTLDAAICERLARSAIADRLETLDLSNTALEDGDAIALTAGRFARLRRLAASDNELTHTGVSALEAICANVEISAAPG